MLAVVQPGPQYAADGKVTKIGKNWPLITCINNNNGCCYSARDQKSPVQDW